MSPQFEVQVMAQASLTDAVANQIVTDGQMLEDTKKVLDAQIQSSSAAVTVI